MTTYSLGHILLILVYTIHLCASTVPMLLIRVGRVPTHFKKYWRQDYTLDSDPLNSFQSPHDKNQLCTTVTNAKQFTHLYNSMLKTATRAPNFITVNNNTIPSSKLKIQQCQIRMSPTSRQIIQCLQCVGTEDVEWFVAFGQINQFMYLLEPGTSSDNIDFRMTGIFESTAIKDGNRSFLYLQSQFQKSVDATQEICTRYGLDDKLRLCSSVFYALHRAEILPMNYLKVQKNCVLHFIKGRSFFKKAHVMPCSVLCADEGTLLRQFFIMKDSREQGAVIVLNFIKQKIKTIPKLEMYTRVVNIPALLNPFGKDIRQLKKRTGSDSKSSISRKEKGKGKSKIEYSSEDSDDVETIIETKDNPISRGQNKRKQTINSKDSEETIEDELDYEELFDPWENQDSSIDAKIISLEDSENRRLQERRRKQNYVEEGSDLEASPEEFADTVRMKNIKDVLQSMTNEGKTDATDHRLQNNKKRPILRGQKRRKNKH